MPETSKESRLIECKSGVAFAAHHTDKVDDEWMFYEFWYKIQGCTVSTGSVELNVSCDCDHCTNLDHRVDEIIEEIKQN